MRTTVSLDDDVYERARTLAFERRRTLGQIINELLIAGLQVTDSPPPPRRLGALRGSVWIAEDFDDTPAEVVEALDRPL